MRRLLPLRMPSNSSQYKWRISDTIEKKDHKLQNLNKNTLEPQTWEG
jgi:hypothetical protein